MGGIGYQRDVVSSYGFKDDGIEVNMAEVLVEIRGPEVHPRPHREENKYRFTKGDVVEILMSTDVEAYDKAKNGWRVELVFFGSWFPVSMGSRAL